MKNEQAEILIVDDNPENLKVLNRMLKDEGFNVRAAQNGKQALASILETEPDLVLLDVNMPEMNGIEVCRKLKSDSRYKNLPVIFLSALDDSFNKSQGLSAGAVDYMTKPFDVDEVKHRVKTHLLLKHSLDEAARLRFEVEEKNREILKLKEKLGK